MSDPTTNVAPVAGSPERPAEAYRAALRRYDLPMLREILAALGRADRGLRANGLADEIADYLDDPRAVDERLAALPPGARQAIGLFAMTDTSTWPAVGLIHSLNCLGVQPLPTLGSLVRHGLLVARVEGDGAAIREIVRRIVAEEEVHAGVELVAHPSAMAVVRTILPGGPGPPRVDSVRQIREADGLEPILRLAALWQSVAESPLRHTQQGTLYKRDRDRLEEDPVLAGPIADALEPLPDMVSLWLGLAQGVGLIEQEPDSDRIVAAPPDYWAENAVHLPQMSAARWLGLQAWHEQAGARDEGSTALLAAPFLRPAVLLWLATLADDEWVAVEDLADHLGSLCPAWDRMVLRGSEPPSLVPTLRPARGKLAAPPGPGREAILESILLGPAYQLRLVRLAEETMTGRRAVQLSALGRYTLAIGPPPGPPPAFEQFLFVQPNFEVVAYRQGLTPSLIGQFSRFARWSQLGAALELKLTPDSIYRGLEGGLMPEQMLERLARHSARPLPAGVAEAVRTWSDRRDKLTYYAAATLIEFASPDALELALTTWPADATSSPVRISDRLLLVEDASTIPFHRFRLTGSRDYRRPPEPCLDIDPDGVTLVLDLGRSDLLIDAELSRFADELPSERPSRPDGVAQRRFRVSLSSLARAADHGMTTAQIARWFPLRTGTDLPPALRLLLYTTGPNVDPLTMSRPLVLTVPLPDLLDGLVQHPSTRNYLGERLGPTAIIIPEELLPSLQRALTDLGFALEDLASTRGASSTPAGRLRIKRT